MPHTRSKSNWSRPRYGPGKRLRCALLVELPGYEEQLKVGSLRDILNLAAELGGVDLERDGLEVRIGKENYTIHVDADRVEFVLNGKDGRPSGTRRPAPKPKSESNWWTVLGYRSLDEARRLGPSELRKRHRELSIQHHPDRGGSSRKQQQLNDAVRTAKAYFDW